MPTKLLLGNHGAQKLFDKPILEQEPGLRSQYPFAYVGLTLGVIYSVMASADTRSFSVPWLRVIRRAHPMGNLVGKLYNFVVNLLGSGMFGLDIV